MVGNAIKNLREKKKIPQSVLANKTGLKQCQISKIERGERKVTAEELGLFAEALGVEVSKLVETA